MSLTTFIADPGFRAKVISRFERTLNNPWRVFLLSKGYLTHYPYVF